MTARLPLHQRKIRPIVPSKDLIGKTYGRLTVIALLPREIGVPRKFSCICSCGNSKFAQGNHLLTGNTKSCGCFEIETTTKHGLCRTSATVEPMHTMQRYRNSGQL